MKNVIVLGKGELAVRISQWFHESEGYNLKAVVPVIPEPKWTESLSEWAKLAGVPIIESGHYKDIEGVKEESWQIDLAFSVFYDKIIREWFINKCNQILNLHNAPLPKYRGVSPINWALKNNESEHGVTIHEITPGIDDGPIISQTKYTIYAEFDEVISVYKRGLEFGWTLFKETVPILDSIVPKPQNDALATYYSKNEDHLLLERKHFTRAKSLQI